MMSLLRVMLGGCALALALGWGLANGEARREDERPPNVIVLLADDLAPRILGFDGNRDVRSPHLDRMALAGTVFDRAYVPLPQCGPSRAALMTGQYPHRLGVMTNEGARLPRRVPTLARRFAGAGYRCGFVGKWGLGVTREPQAGFDAYWRPLARTDSYQAATVSVEGEAVELDGWLPSALTALGIEFIEQSAEEPFFLWISYKTPHEPLSAPPESRHAYAAADLAAPESANDDLSHKPSAQRAAPPHRDYVERGATLVQEQRALYYAMVSALDEGVGQLADYLDEKGLAEETLVVFLSDNGWLLGEHQMFAKGPALYEELVRTPMFFRWPGRVPAGERSAALVSSLDLFPTLVSLFGKPPRDADGTSLWPVLDGEVEKVRDALYLEYWKRRPDEDPVPMLGVVTPRFKYTRYLGSSEEELYDLDTDPEERHNLAASADHEPELERLRGLLDVHARRIEKPFW